MQGIKKETFTVKNEHMIALQNWANSAPHMYGKEVSAWVQVVVNENLTPEEIRQIKALQTTTSESKTQVENFDLSENKKSKKQKNKKTKKG